jgi:hypothetical protein
MEGAMDRCERTHCGDGHLVSVLLLTYHSCNCRESRSNLVTNLHLNVGKRDG